jgi:hypothetical protein
MLREIITHSEQAEANFNIETILNMAGGFEKIALEKLPPFIRDTRDYLAFGRKILAAHNVTSEELMIIDGEPYFYYSKDMESEAAFYGADGMIPRTQIEGEGVYVGIVTIASDDTTINLKRLLVQKFNYLERIRQLSGQAVAKLEDTKILSLVEAVILGASVNYAAPTNSAQVVTTADTTLAKASLVRLKSALTQNDVGLGCFAMNGARLDDMLAWDQDEVDQVTQRELLQEGNKYSIWSVPIHTSSIINVWTVYAFAPPSYVGRMPILKDLTAQLTETPNKLERGLFMFEFIGFFIASHKAVAKLVINYASGATTPGYGGNGYVILSIAAAQTTAGSVVGDGVGTTN